MIQPFKDYMESLRRHSERVLNEGVTITESQSRVYPDRTNVIVQADTFDSCQSAVMTVMEREGIAEFTLPVRAPEYWVAYGHFPRKDRLPEL